MFKKPLPPIPAPTVPEISVQEVHDKITRGQLPEFRFIDVRTTDEYNTVHIPDVDHREQDHKTHVINTDGLKKDDEIIISCQSGRRSAFVTDYLIKAGFSNVKSMHGGINEWIKAGFEIMKKSALKIGGLD